MGFSQILHTGNYELSSPSDQFSTAFRWYASNLTFVRLKLSMFTVIVTYFFTKDLTFSLQYGMIYYII